MITLRANIAVRSTGLVIPRALEPRVARTQRPERRKFGEPQTS